VIDIDRLGNATHGLYATEIGVEVRKIDNPSKVALEEALIRGIEAHQSHEQLHVRLGQLGSAKEFSCFELLSELVQHVGQFVEGLLIGNLRGGRCDSWQLLLTPGIVAVSYAQRNFGRRSISGGYTSSDHYRQKRFLPNKENDAVCVVMTPLGLTATP
jgi:hypothetical protein